MKQQGWRRDTPFELKQRLALVLLWLALGSFAVDAVAQTTRYVRVDGTDSGTCASLPAACANVSYAFAQASANDTIDIGPGEFTVSGLVLNLDISLVGAGRDQPDNTVLSAHRFPGQATNNVLNIWNNEEVNISDLEISNGVRNNSSGGGIYVTSGTLTLQNVAFRDNQATNNGGGLYIQNGNATLNNVLFQNNSAGKGGGMYNLNTDPVLDSVDFVENDATDSGGGMYNVNSNPAMTGGRFLGNQAINNGAGVFNELSSSGHYSSVVFQLNEAGNGATGNGGGMYNLTASSPILVDVIFFGNAAANFSGGMHNRDGSSPQLTRVEFSQNFAGVSGGGMNNREGVAPLLIDVHFFDNTTGEYGGGMYNYTDSAPAIRNATFRGNIAGLEGGAVRNLSSTASFVNAHFSGNHATTGGAMSNSGGAITLINNTFHRNNAVERGGGIYSFESSPILRNTIVWDNGANQGNEMFNHVLNGNISVSAHHSLYGVAPNDFVNFTQGTGSINFDLINVLHVDPLFVNPDYGILRLSKHSPARNAGNPLTDPALFPGGPGSPVDINGLPRFREAVIDMGAYEYQPPIFADGFEDKAP